ncbi:MAG TPA: 3-hydroxyacyl-CoA dehydrogenase NAD-binding domain-containing protein, partial [Parasegetibacter sp.]
GTMGQGIAQVAAQSGYITWLYDLSAVALNKARNNIQQQLSSQVQKGRLSEEEKEAVSGRLRYITIAQECKADLIIEAIIEKIAPKVSLFQQLAEINSAETLFASNTSSLSVTELAAQIPNPERVAGMHFFNPATHMKLVEVVSSSYTSSNTTDIISEVCRKMKKTPVLCKDAPGFIVNRVARHFYLESLYYAEKVKPDYEVLDRLLESSGFKMGPFRLMDLIGNDINYAVTCSLYDAYDHIERFRPSPIQKTKVDANELGRKTGKGYYDYSKNSSAL